MIGQHAEISCQDCGKTIKKYHVCECGGMYVVEADDHVIFRKYQGEYLLNQDTETGECYKYRLLSKDKILSANVTTVKIIIDKEEQASLGWDGAFGFDYFNPHALQFRK